MQMNATQRREYIVLTAVDLAHEKGFHYVSTKEIARRLSISEALIYKLFPKKNDILTAVLEQFAIYDNDIFCTAMEKYEDAFEGILFVLQKFLAYYENYPAITAVYQAYGTLSSEPELENKVNAIFFRRVEALKRMVVKAWEAGSIREEWNPEPVADILSSIVTGMCLQWRMRDFDFSLMERTLWAVELFLGTIKERGMRNQSDRLKENEHLAAAFTCMGQT